MIRILFILLLLPFFASSQVAEVIPSEYKVAFLKTDGTAHAPYWSGSNTRTLAFNGGHTFVYGDGGLYNILFLKANGDVYVHNNSNRDLSFLQYDDTGGVFKAVDVECYLRTYIAVRDDGTVWARNYNSYRWFGSDVNLIVNAWTKIPGQPAGVTFTKIRKGGETGSGTLYAITDDGDVWGVNDNSTTWTQKTFPVPIHDIHAGMYNFYVAIGTDKQPYGWGVRKYLGVPGTGSITTYEELKGHWNFATTDSIIDMGVNDNTIHFIKNNNTLWGLGDNAMGLVGTGEELVNRKELYAGTWYVWNWLNATSSSYQNIAFVSSPVRIRPDKLFDRVYAGNYYTHYKYARELGTGDLYGWGRNKGAVLLNGRGASNESPIPNSMDVLTPTYMNVFVTTTPSPSTFVKGTVNAGSNQSIESSSTTLSGSATAGGTSSWSYSISSYQWLKLSGPSCTIVSPTAATTDVTGMTPGVYSFQFKVTDNNTATYTDTVQVTVTSMAYEVFGSATQTGSGTASLTSTVSSPNGVRRTKWTVLTRPSQPTYKVFIGGSSTPAGSTGVTSADSAWPRIYKRFLKSYNLLDTMYERAAGGTSTRNGLPTSTGGYGVSNWDTSRNITYATKRAAHLALIGYASNDMTAYQATNHMGWFRETRDSAVLAGMEYWVTTAQPRPGYNTTEENKLVALADSQRAQLNYIEAYRTLVTYGTMNFRPEYDFGDGIHTNNAGQAQLGINVIATNPLQNLTKGPATFTNQTSQNATVSGLTNGLWRFMVMVEDTLGMHTYDIVELTVSNAANVLPVVGAGEDQEVNSDSTTLIGTASDSDGTIVSYEWSLVSGAECFISTASDSITGVKFYESGTYTFRLTVFDNSGGSASSDVTVVVDIPAVVPDRKKLPRRLTGATRFIKN